MNRNIRDWKAMAGIEGCGVGVKHEWIWSMQITDPCASATKNPEQIICNTPLHYGVICMLHCVGLRRLSGLLIQVGRRHSPPDASTNIATLLTGELGPGFGVYLRRASICNTWPVSGVLINTEMTHLVSCSIVHNTVACSPVRSIACSLVSFS